MRRSSSFQIIFGKSGYTLLSVMIALSVLGLVAGVIAAISTITYHQMQKENVGRKDVWVFLHQLEFELTDARAIDCSQHKLTFQKDKSQVSYQVVGTNLRRTLNSSGNEIVIRGLNQFECTFDMPFIDLTIVDSKGKMYRWMVQNMVE